MGQPGHPENATLPTSGPAVYPLIQETNRQQDSHEEKTIKRIKGQNNLKTKRARQDVKVVGVCVLLELTVLSHP
jgi:hypothetical protein